MKQVNRIVVAACFIFWGSNMVWYVIDMPELYQISNALVICVMLGALIWFIRGSFWLWFFFFLSMSNVVKNILPTREMFMVNDYFIPPIAIVAAWIKVKKKRK